MIYTTYIHFLSFFLSGESFDTLMAEILDTVSLQAVRILTVHIQIVQSNFNGGKYSKRVDLGGII